MDEIPSDNTESFDDELLLEYEFDYSKASPNRFANRVGGQRLKVVVLDEDVAKVFTTPQSVNEALRMLIASKQ